MPQNLENPVVNRYLKDLGKWVGIDQITVLPSSKGGKRIDIRKPKFEFMQTHTARRSFATNAFLSGVEPLDIRKSTGHTTERLFLQYIKVDADRHAVRISKTAFFQKPETK